MLSEAFLIMSSGVIISTPDIPHFFISTIPIGSIWTNR